jgi:hypothetical protein
MAVDINALASQSATQGQNMLNDDLDKANLYKNQYSDYQAQADAANKNVNNYTDYMKNEGSAGNQYHTEQNKELGDLGYSEGQMNTARNNLNQSTGALSAYSDFANTAASKWGMNAGGFAAANAGALSGLNNNIASNQNVVNGLGDLYKTAQTGANQFTGQVIQGEQNTMAGLQQVFTNATNQRDSAASMMNFYNQLASSQGGLNAQQQQYYAAAKQAYAAASAAQAQAALYGAQASQVQQQINQGNDYMNSPAYKSYLAGSGGANGSPSSPVANSGGLGGTRIAQDLGTGALNLGKWLWTDTAGKAASGAKSVLGKVF